MSLVLFSYLISIRKCCQALGYFFCFSIFPVVQISYRLTFLPCFAASSFLRCCCSHTNLWNFLCATWLMLLVTKKTNFLSKILATKPEKKYSFTNYPVQNCIRLPELFALILAVRFFFSFSQQQIGNLNCFAIKSFYLKVRKKQAKKFYLMLLRET